MILEHSESRSPQQKPKPCRGILTPLVRKMGASLRGIKNLDGVSYLEAEGGGECRTVFTGQKACY